jgi:DNA polymerase III delta prime subunit
VYEQAGGQLLIVGPPGSGKTTEALKLMRHLLEAARRDSSSPVPELFPLASWAKERKPIVDGLADQLQLRHGWAPREGRSLIWHHRVVPFLDGLDEIATEHRAACVHEINRFWESHRGGPLVLCSRPKEYEELPERVKFGGAVRVCPPEAQQIDEYLTAAGPHWAPVREELQAGSNRYLQELLATPLMLSIAVLAYLDGDLGELCEAHDAERHRVGLWLKYVSAVDSRLTTRADETKSTPVVCPTMKRWVVTWLARLRDEGSKLD